MKDICSSDYKKILLDMMDAIDSYCRDNNITYYMLGGTLLGAVRHHGFIPWDDDMDIGIKRQDYDRFCEHFNELRNDTYRVVDLNNTNDYYTTSAKVIDTRTALIENAYQAIELGAFIDVFPLDYFGDDKYKIAVDLLTHKTIGAKLKSAKTMNISKKRAWYKNLVIVFSRLLCHKSMNEMAKEYDANVRLLSSSSDNKYLANLCGAWGQKEIADARLFDEAIELIFEERKYFAPKGYDAYLTGLYGDYMKLPPEEKRVTHHDNQVKWKEF